ncbi:hypothetical protein OG883_42820 [Streptomyces sp. NBC_01142]|uniref:hypothetical protein n=1 Tax=Streptomyces sp. NBC_01142 TaxID=2975865 RepID=UPI0022557445|nr:hypothetical protein [Streptomyces sp. NBC_01142]MCX4826378.1 hypothetical protein [Streptomyces sp. NBC_01142]
MHNAVNEALADIRVEPAGHLLGRPEPGLTYASWTHLLEQLEATGRSIVPRSIPTRPACEVLTFRLQSTFGFLLDAAARFLDSGSKEDAERTAHEARTVKALTVAPALRHHREEAPPTGGTREELLEHRVTAEGNGFLALSVVELTAAIGPDRKVRGLLPAELPLDPAAFVVLWNRISAPGLILAGMNAAHTDGEHGAALLQSHLATAAQALVPGETRHDWQ